METRLLDQIPAEFCFENIEPKRFVAVSPPIGNGKVID